MEPSRRSACHHGGASRALVLMWLMVLEPLGSRVARSAGVRQVAPARLLPGLRRLPRQGSCRGSLPRPLAFCVSSLGVALIGLRLWLPSSALLSVAVGAALPARAQVKGYKRESPYFCTPTGAPGLGPHISAPCCWARPRTVRGQVGRILPQ